HKGEPNGKECPELFAQFRDIYVWGAQGTRKITADDTELITDGLVLVDATAGNVIYTLLPTVSVPNQRLIVQKIDSTSHTVTIQPHSGDTIGGASFIVLTDQWETWEIKANG